MHYTNPIKNGKPFMAMEIIELPEPEDNKTFFFKDLLNERYTVRGYKSKALPINEISYILWTAYGLKRGGGRVVPSAGGTYPLDIYLSCGDIEIKEGDKIPSGVYLYIPEKHQLNIVKTGDLRKNIANASLSQMWMAEAPCMIIVTCEYERITHRYRDRGIRYAIMEAGNVSQNISLSCFYRGLGCGIVGAFNDELVKNILGIKKVHEPLLIVPIGYR